MLGFLEGVLATESIESLAVASIRPEAEQFLQLVDFAGLERAW